MEALINDIDMFDPEVISIHELLKSRKQTVAAAESVTSGLLQLALSSMPDARTIFQGGITAYNLGQKARHLQVEPIYAELDNCVSAAVAEQMAKHVCGMFRSDWGISVTGYATPVPESGDRVYAYYAIAYNGSIIDLGKVVGNADDTALQTQQYYVTYVIKQLEKILKKNPIRKVHYH